MFEHLDDPRPPVLGDRFRRETVARGRRRRRRRRLQGAAGVTVATLLVGVGGLYGRVAWRADDIERVDVTSTGEVAADAPLTVLLVGADTLAGETEYAETLLLARIDPAGTVALLSLPRDLMVGAPDGSGPVVINAVYATGGLDGLLTVIEGEIGIPVDHVVRVGFDGFVSLVDRVGGIEVSVDTPVRDRSSGLYIDDTGCVSLDGEQALAAARSRRVEWLDGSGNWVHDPLSDLRRVSTQRQLLIAALAALGDESADPVTLDRHVTWALEHLVVDAGLGSDDLVRMVRSLTSVDPAAVSSASLPVVPYPQDENRLAADPAASPATVEAFVTGRPLPGDPPASEPEPDAAALPGGDIITPC